MKGYINMYVMLVFDVLSVVSSSMCWVTELSVYCVKDTAKLQLPLWSL